MRAVKAGTWHNLVYAIPVVIAFAAKAVFSADTLTAARDIPDTASTAGVVSPAYSLSATVSAADTAQQVTIGSQTPQADSLTKSTLPPSAPKKSGSENIKLIKRTYSGRQQVLLAVGMMIFVVAIMTAAQQWNPR